MASYKAIVEMMDKRPGKKKYPGVDPEREALQRVRDQILGNDDRTVRLRRDGGETGYGSLDDLNEYWASFNDRLHQAVDDYDTVGYGNASSLYTKHQVRLGNLDKHLNTLRNWAQWLLDRGDANERLVSQINSWIDAYRGDVSNVMEAFREANDYYSQWDTEEAFNAYKIQAGEFDHIENFDADSEAGWDAYQTDAQREQDAFARALAMVGGTDAMSPAGSFASAMNTFRADDSDKKPNDNWTDAQKSYFGYLYQTDREKAWEYAQQINSEMAYQAQATAREQIRENAVEHPVANTLGALGTAPFGLADYLTDIAEYSATGEIGQKGTVSPFDYSQEVTGGIAQNLNEKFGTLNDSIPIIGGKGWGDVYGLGTSIAQSAIAAYTGGAAGTLVQFFGSAGAAGIDEAKRRGASDDQAVVYGTLSGAAEALAEMVGVDNLLKIGSSTTLRGFLKNVLKQASAEGLEEGITSLMNNFSDQLVMADKSNFYVKVQAYMNNGLSEEEAKKRAWIDMAEDIAFDMLGGFVSGGVHAGPQTAYQTYIQSKNADSNAQQAEEADYSEEQFEEEVPVQPVKEPVVPVQPQRTEAPVRQAEVPAQQVQKPVATVQPQRTEDPLNQTVVPAQQEADPVRQLAEQVSAEQVAPRQETAPANTEDASRKAQPLPGQENAPATDTVDAQNKEVVQKPSVAETVPAKVRSIASIKDGRMMLEAEDGSTIDSSEVSYGSLDEANVYGAVSELDGIIDTTTANKLSKHLMKLGNSSSEVYSRGIVQAYTYGYYGYSRDAMTGEKTLSATLTEEQRNVAYGYGEQYRKAKITADQANARKGGIRKEATGKEIATAPDGTQYKKVRFEGEITHWSDKRKAEVAFMDFIASNFSGNTVHVIESYKDSDGRYVYKDNNGNVKIAPNGMYEPSTGDMYIDLNAGAGGDGLVMNTFAHEMFHHIKRRSPAKAQKVAEFIAQELGYENVEAAVRRQINLAERSNHGVASFVEGGMSESAAERLVYDRAYEDFIANSLETMFTEGDVVSKLQKLKSQDKNLFTMIKEFIDQWVQKLRKFYSGHRTLSIEGDMVAHLEKFEQIQQMFVEALVDAGDNYQASLIPGEEGTVVNGNGDPVALATEDGSVLLSMRTYEEDGRKAFRDYLQKCVTSDKLTKAEMQEMIDGIEEIYQTCKEFKDKYAPFGSWSDAAVVRDTHGRPVFSVVTPNGDYKMNLDFSLVCKKRRTLDAVFNEMSRRGIIDDFELGQKSVVKINEIIRKHGLETACALCFVDAKRFRQASMADSFVRLYNELVESLVPADQRSSIDHFNFAGYETIRKVDSGIDTWANSELDFSHLDYVMKNYEKGTVEHKAARYIKTHPEGRRLLLRGDFMSSKGFDAVKTQNMDVMKLYNSKKGTGGPKAAFGDVQYMNEIINKARTWTPAKAYAVGGIRIQSFSDYVPRMVFDYTQMIYDLAATKLPAHAYTKEALFVKQFGLTGVKINMSLIPAIAEGGIAPGLDANGDYVWAGESFDFETAKEIQNAEGYTENCGTICVGVSYQHIIKLLGDPNIRMVIPYHKSGLNPIVAHMNKVAKFTDYTSLKTNPGGCQSTIDKNGKKVENDFNFNEVLRKTGDPKATVRQYLDWCAKNGHTPRFAEFAWHENYYKLIEDFTLYDKDGNYVPQREVRAVFPKEGSAFGSMKDLIQEGLQEDAVVEGKRDSSLSSIVDEIQQTLPGMEDEIAEDQVAQADHDLEADVKYSDRDTESVSNRALLANAFEGAAQTDKEREKIQEYRGQIDLIQAEEQKLRELNAQIRELSFAKGKRDTKKIRELRDQATETANRISVYDQQLLRLEASKPLQDMLAREKKRAYQQAEQRHKEAQEAYRLKAEVRQSEILRDYRETRAALRQSQSETALMEKEFIRLVKAYEKLEAKSKKDHDTQSMKSAKDAKTIDDLKAALKKEAQSHKEEQHIWDAEFKRLMREYEAAGRSIDTLERKIKRQKENSEKTVMRNKIRKVVKELNSLLKEDSKKRHVPDSLKKAVADALSLVNMDSVDVEKRIAEINHRLEELYFQKAEADRFPNLQAKQQALQAAIDDEISLLDRYTKMGDRIRKLYEAYEEIQGSDDPDIANAYDHVIAGCIKELAGSIGDTPLMKMTIEQLSDVYDMYHMVLTRVRDANKSFTNAKNESISNMASRVIGEVRTAGGEHKLRATILDVVKKFDWNNLKPVFAMERIGSATLTNAFNGVRSGEDTWVKNVTEAREYYLEKAKKYGYDSWDFDRKYTFKSTSGDSFELTLEQIMSLYAYSKRDQAGDHLRIGGIVFDSNIETYKETVEEQNGKVKRKKSFLKYKVNIADSYQISAEILANIISKLSREQIGFVDEMQDYLSTTMGSKGNEVTMAMYGVKLFKEKFYFPLKSAKQFMFEQNEVAGEVKIKNSGFTNKTVAQANNPIILSNFMDVWTDHVNAMSMYHAFTLPLEDFNRIFNYNSPKKEGQPPVSVKGTIQNAYSPAAVSYVKELITDLNGGARTDPRETTAKAMMAKFKKAKVMASMSVVVQQPSAIGRAFALVAPKYFRPTKDGMNHDQLWNELKQYAPVAVIKEMGYFDTNMGKSTQDFIMAKEYSGFKEQFKAIFADSDYRDETITRLPALADELTWCAIWNAVKRETVSTHKDLRPGSEEFLRAAGERFTEVVMKTQVYDSVLARSANMRSKSGMMNMATSFMAEPTTTINMLEDAIVQSKRGNKGYAAKVFASVATSIVLNNALASIVYAMRDDDEDETYLEKYLESFVSGMLDNINPLTYYPFLKDVWSLLQGYDIERSDMSLISDMADALKKLVVAYNKEDGDIKEAWWLVAESMANLGGIPVQNMLREYNAVRNFLNTIKQDMNGRKSTKGSIQDTLQETVRDTLPIIGWLPGDSKADKLYDAIVSGDTVYVNRLKGSYVDEDGNFSPSAYTSAIRKGLRENDPRIHDAAVAKNSGDLGEYMRIAKEIIGESYFSQDDVVAAINAEIDAMSKDDTTSSKKKASGLFKAEDFAVAISQDDQAMARAIKTDIIETAQKNGDTIEDAEKSFNSSVKSALKEMFFSGEISKQTVTDALVTYTGMEEDDIYWMLDKWDYASETSSAEGYGKYDDFLTAVQTGQNLKAVIQQYTDNGVEQQTLANQIRDHFKPMYMEMSTAERANIKGYLLNGFEQCGVDRKKAEDKIGEWEFEADHPELVDRITYTQYKRWQTDGKPNGVSVELFTNVAEYRDNGSETRSQDEVMYYIMSLTRDKRTRHALWCCFYKESTSPFT